MHLLQIWIIPERKGLKPSYEEKKFAAEDKRGGLRLIGSRDGRDGSVTIHQDVSLYAAVLGEGDTVRHEIGKGRVGWVQVARGRVTLDGKELRAGDGAAIDAAGTVELAGSPDAAEVLLFDMVA